MSYKEKCSTINGIADYYRIDNMENKLSFRQESELIDYINSIIESLSDESKRIILNDYFHKQDDYWYLEYYQRSTYYRLKTKAIEEFLHCLHYQ